MNLLRRVLSCRISLVLLLSLSILAITALQKSEAQSGLYVSTFAGVPFAGSFADGPGSAARFNAPLGLAIDREDNLIVADFRGARIRKIDPAGNVTTIAGGVQGFANGIGTAARFYGPAGVAIDKNGNILVADYGNNRIRQIAPNGVVTTIAGSGQYGNQNGAALTARFARPTGVAVDEAGVIYVLDSATNLIRKIDTNRIVTTLAGNYNGYNDGIGEQASFSFSGAAPQLCFDRQGNLIVADFFNSRLRQVTPEGVVTTIAGDGNFELKDGPALQASFFLATAVAPDNDGNIIVGDWHNGAVRRLNLTQRTVSTIAGNGVEDHVDGPALQASFVRPGGVAVDSKGNIFVSDYFTHTIRRIGPRSPNPGPSPSPSPSPTVTPTPTPPQKAKTAPSNRMASRLGRSGFSGSSGGLISENRSPFRWTSNSAET